MKRALCITVFCLFFLVSCKGFMLSVKSEKNNTLLVIKSTHTDSGDRSYGSNLYYEVTGYGSTGETNFTISNNQNNNCYFIKPGVYDRWNIRLKSSSDKYFSTFDFNCRVVIESGSITIFPYKIMSFTTPSKNIANTIMIYSEKALLPQDELYKLVTDYKKDEAFYTWDKLYVGDRVRIKNIGATVENEED